MPFLFIIVGLILLVSGVKGTSGNLVTLLEGDLTGTNNFIYWILAIGVVGALGYADTFKGLSRAFLVLVIIVLVLREQKNGAGGFFSSFTSAISTITKSGATS